MPVMYRTGEQKYFRSPEEGAKGGYFPTFNALAAFMRQEKYGKPKPKPKPMAKVVPKPKKPVDPNRLTQEQIYAKAAEFGFETDGLHHMKIRAIVEAHIKEINEQRELQGV